MKKILVVLSLICFVAVNISKAQTQAATSNKETKKEAVETKSADGSMSSGCSHSMSKSCCKKSSMKACTPEEKAKCAAGKSKAEADASTKEEVKAGKN